MELFYNEWTNPLFFDKIRVGDEMKRSEVNLSKLTPMMKQYVDIKNKYEDVIIFFRLGDF